ncbi:MAG: response regulator [Kiritimatiellia bacterium]
MKREGQSFTSSNGQGPLILVVDDEAPIRRLVSRVLDQNGFCTLLAMDGQEAVDLFTERQEEIAAVVLDLVMPGMDGAAAARAMRRLNPALPVLAMSGMKTCPEDEITTFLRKPLNADGLLAALRNLLDTTNCP